MAAASLPLEVRALDNVDPFIAEGCKNVTAFMGPRIALIVDNSCEELVSLCMDNQAQVARVIANLERLLASYDDVVGKSPELEVPFEGRVRVEISNIPAAGLAHHGQAGIATGPAFLESTLQSHIDHAVAVASTGGDVAAAAAAGAPPPNLHHVFTYEFLRNYIFPEEFTPVWDYRVVKHVEEGDGSGGAGAGAGAGAASAAAAAAEPDTECWGWVNQGFINVTGCLLSTEISDAVTGVPLAFDYFGNDADAFMGGMEKHLTKYKTGGEHGALSWKQAFYRERLPWETGASLDNLYSGLIVDLWRRNGKGRFLRRWWRGALPYLRSSRLPTSKWDVVTARDNFFLAACFAANADLTRYFVDTLRWPISDSVPAPFLREVLAEARACEL